MNRTDLIAPIPTQEDVCRTCGAQLKGMYCSDCGERKYVAGEHTVTHFFGDILNAITFVDSKFIRTLKLMFRSPGKMSYFYINGRRVPFIKPMSMFFIVNLLYFMFPMSDGFNSKLSTQMNNMPYSSYAEKMVMKRLKEEKKDMKTFMVEYETQSTNMAKMYLVLLVIFFSVPLWLVNYRKNLSYFDHLTVSLEVMSMTILVSFVLLVWLFYWIARLATLPILMTDNYLSIPSIFILLWLFFFTEKNAYGHGTFRSVAKAAFLLFCCFLCVQLYRASLFFITMWTL